MLKKIKIKPIAAESFGVRSMATFVETPDTTILVDPGCALGPRRGDSKTFYYPHPLEYKALKLTTEKIIDASKSAKRIIITHYHHDHYKPSFTDYFTLNSNKEIAKAIFSNKIIYAKDFHDFINTSQRKRGFLFNKIMKNHFQKIFWADSQTFKIDNTDIIFSPPVYHGEPKAKGGWILMCTIIYDDERFLFTSDIQGPMVKETLNYILNVKPNLVYIGGPPIYLKNLIPENFLNKAIKNLEKIVESIPAVIIDHHLLRDKNWRKWADPLFNISFEKKYKIYCASEYLGVPEKLLEAKRGELYKKQPPNEEFMKWLNLPQKRREKTVPPI
ncbi:MAG: MBL fold metallo-hydrolase [Candidatus Helarchaeota archaeon]